MGHQRDEHRVHLIVYQLIWHPKRRKSVLVGALAKERRKLIEGKDQERGWAILGLAIQPDHPTCSSERGRSIPLPGSPRSARGLPPSASAGSPRTC
jgi:hypothetical protein